MRKPITILSGSASYPLASSIGSLLDIKAEQIICKKFPCGEIFLQIPPYIENQQVIFIHSISSPTNDHFMELLLAIDTLKNAGAKKVIVVLPYLAYSRQDKNLGDNSSKALKLMEKLFTALQVDQIIALELHSPQSFALSAVPTINLLTEDLAIDYIKSCSMQDLTLVSPDNGGEARVEKIAKHLKLPFALLNKSRSHENEVSISLINGRVAKRDCIIVDDIVDSADTLCAAASFLTKNGAKSIKAFVTHGVLSTGSVEKITNSNILELVITDSIFWTNELLLARKIKIQTVAPLIADALRRII